VLNPARATDWAGPAGATDLPRLADPADGFVASANDRPPPGDIPLGFLFSPIDRVQRLRRLLADGAAFDLASLPRLQLDTRSEVAPGYRDRLLARLGSRRSGRAEVEALRGWDGSYDTASRGAVVYEVVMAELARRLAPRALLAPVSAVWTSRGLLAQHVFATPDARLLPALDRAFDRAARVLRRHRDWGGVHRLVLRHHFAALPGLGRRFTYADLPAAGGNGTLDKTGHAPARGRHSVTFGASARFITDLSDPDANRAVLLGGQDGWLGSGNFLDQVTLWQAGRYLDLPLRAVTARAWPHHTAFDPP
jgi:penicillin amidase